MPRLAPGNRNARNTPEKERRMARTPHIAMMPILAGAV